MTLKSLQQYGKAFQLKVLGSLLTDKKFLLNVRDVLYPDYFDADSHKWIITQIVEYFDQYHTIVTMDVLKVELHKVENEVLQVALKEELRNSYAASRDDLDYIQEEFTNFCKNQEMKNAILNSADLLKLGDFDGIRGLVEKAIKAGMDKNIGHEYNKDIETRYRVDYRPTIPSPWSLLNDGLQGGFGPGDLGIVFGSPGGGKSWTMVAIAAHAVQLGYKVNYYTLELGEDYVGKRFDCYFTGYNIDEINKHRKDVQTYVNNLKGKLIVKEYPPKGASISTIKAHVQKCVDMDHKPDLIVIDYVDYLRAPSKSKYSERKDEIDDNFIATKGLAKDLKIPILTPSQVNRMGARDSVIEGDKAAGSYDKMMVADICLSLSRMKEDKVLGTGRIHVMKNRYGQDGMTYNIKMDTNNGHIEFEGKADPSELVPDESKPTFNLDSATLSKIFEKK
jgi:replicative DNA helicase|tara:strand:- start:337 stop:1683 length:1347 start_codon:yes stop_codon:yes gene_type:complete